MTRVLLAEDSATVRQLVKEILQRDPEIEIVAEAEDGAEAIELTARLAPDVVVMDADMPKMDGLEATKAIMTRVPTPIVVISSRVKDQIDISLSATQAGALLVLPKPAPPGEGDEEERERFRRTIKAMAEVKVVRRWARPAPEPPPEALTTATAGRIRIVALAASTGGPAAIRRLLEGLPQGFPAPLLVVQHMAPGFMEGFAEWLSRGCALRVQLGRHGEPVHSGVVYVAPDDRHLGVSRTGHIRLDAGPPLEGFRPSATHLFESVAATYGAGAAAVILSGMGTDGVRGLRVLHAAGGRVLAQDEASAIVYGMAREAVVSGVVDETLSLERIGSALIEGVEGG